MNYIFKPTEILLILYFKDGERKFEKQTANHWDLF